MEKVSLKLWEILVPHKMGPNGKKVILVPYHREWDDKVREITGGLTILKASKGQWVDGDGKIYKEIMIPVRIACSDEQIERIVAMTARHYKQKAIFVSLISEHTYIYDTESIMNEVVG